MKRYALLALLVSLLTLSVSAQSDTIIALQSDQTAVETGQYYTVNLILRDAVDVWQVNAEIEYDPNLLYIVGTISGQPMTGGAFFGENPTLMIRNGILDGQLVYTQSLLAPAVPVGGSGTLATFQVYPLSAGTAQLRFTSADIQTITFTDSAEGNRDVASTSSLPVLPALAEFTITGETVPPPDEATPTLSPTATTNMTDRGEATTAEPTLLNVTLAPATDAPPALPTLIPDIASTEDSPLPLLPIAVALLVIGILGVGILVLMARRNNG